jgi:UDP-N-acetylmuramate--alanine ligase
MDPVDQARKMLRRTGHVHMVGIGGIGMAGLARLLKDRGWAVSGCDLQDNRQTRWLSAGGVDILPGHDADHISQSVHWVVRSTAVPDEHPELRRARERGLPVSRRGEVLPALLHGRTSVAVSGTHGKTTTTAIIAQVLGCGFCIGGEIAGTEAVARDGPLMVVEADESDGTVAGYAPDYAVVTNIEFDHMEHHASVDAFTDCFRKLVEKTRRKVFFCGGDPVARALCAGQPGCEPYELPTEPYAIPFPGVHNQWNAAAAMAVCRVWRTEAEVLEAFRSLRSVRRRFETVRDDGRIRVVSDYAHHPTEIAALVRTARQGHAGRVLGVFQPHRYTRTRALAREFPSAFEGVDLLWLLPVYPASEPPLEGGTTEDLLRCFPRQAEGRIRMLPALDAATSAIDQELREGDLLLVIGAGDVERVADAYREKHPQPGFP